MDRPQPSHLLETSEPRSMNVTTVGRLESPVLFREAKDRKVVQRFQCSIFHTVILSRRRLQRGRYPAVVYSCAAIDARKNCLQLERRGRPRPDGSSCPPPPLDQPWAEALIGRSYEARSPEPRPQRPHLVVAGWSACGGGFGQVAFTELQISRPTSDRSGVGFSRPASPPHPTVLGGQYGGTCNRRLT